jgi:hypothetical protein
MDLLQGASRIGKVLDHIDERHGVERVRRESHLFQPPHPHIQTLLARRVIGRCF